MNDVLYPKFLVMFQFGIIGLMVLFSHGILSSAIGISVFLIGLVIGLWAITHNKRDNFNIEPKLKEGCQLVTTGAYNYIRHPMYTSVLTMMLGVLISTPDTLELLLFISLIVVLVLKAKREEKLWCGHDEAYLEYQKNTKLLIPYIL